MNKVFRFFDTALILLILAAVAIAVAFLVSFSPSTWRPSTVVTFAVLPLVVALGLVAAFKLRPEARASLTMVILFSGLALYGIEGFLAFGPRRDPMAGLPAGWDKRTHLEVVRDLRAKGEDAYLLQARQYEHRVTVEGHPVVPVAGIANVSTVVCNETGQYLVYPADRYGFNNPDRVWDQDGIDIALIGDSFAQGACVPVDKSFASVIRDRYPGTLNLGYSDQGPLSELVTLREFAEPFHPTHVFWFFYETNDLFYDLPAELGNPILRRYLVDPAFRQGLMAHAADISLALRDQFDAALARAGNVASPPPSPSLLKRLVQAIKLTEVRTRLGLTVRAPPAGPIARPPEDPAEVERLWAAWTQILSTARSTVATWGGQVHFVYLPGIDSILGHQGFPYHDRVIRTVKAARIPVVDLSGLFSRHPDPLSLWPPIPTEGFDERGRYLVRDRHYSEDGHRLVAEQILSYLTRVASG